MVQVVWCFGSCGLECARERQIDSTRAYRDKLFGLVYWKIKFLFRADEQLVRVMRGYRREALLRLMVVLRTNRVDEWSFVYLGYVWNGDEESTTTSSSLVVAFDGL